MQQIFWNGDNKLRAGWKIIIFIVVLLLCSFIFIQTIIYVSRWFLFDISFLKGEIFFYATLLLVTWIVLHFVEKRKLSSVGFVMRKNVIVREMLFGFCIGGGMMTVIFLVEYGFGMFSFHFKQISLFQFFQMFGTSAIIFIFGAFGEELLFRGYLFQIMTEGVGKITATFLCSASFALMHTGNPNITFLAVLNIMLAGIWFSLAYYKTLTLWFPIALHFSWNFFQNHIFSFSVSGLQFSRYQLGILVQSGPEWFTGGNFGPEGGVIGTIMLLGGIIVVHYFPYQRCQNI